MASLASHDLNRQGKGGLAQRELPNFMDKGVKVSTLLRKKNFFLIKRKGLPSFSTEIKELKPEEHHSTNMKRPSVLAGICSEIKIS